MPISLKHQQVCDLILAGEADAQAYMRVYGKNNPNAARASVSKILRRPDVVEYMGRIRERVQEAVIAIHVKSATEVLADIEAIADADSRELMEYRIGACRCCWGKEFRYQYRPSEWRAKLAAHSDACEAADKKKEPLPLLDEEGGVGYNRTRAPNPDCPECDGEGQGYEYFKDTRTLSPAAAKLFAGVKVTQNGLEIKTASQERARELLARHHGLLDVKRGPNEPGAEGEKPAEGIPAAPEYTLKPDEPIPENPVI